MKKTIQIGAPILVIAALAVLASEQGERAYAYLEHGDSWATASHSYFVNPNFTDPEVGDSGDQIRVMQRSASEWTSAGQIPFQFLYGGTTAVTTVAPTDGTSAVFYSEADGGGALATTTWAAFANGDLFGFDIEFFSSNANTDFVWSLDPGFTEFDVESVAVHEFGHAIGLGHSAVATATMFPSVSPGTTANRTLDADDIAGVQNIYGVQATGSPTVAQVTPDAAWIGGGDFVQIIGNDLSGSDPQVVTFDGIAATDVTVIDQNTIECRVPQGVTSGLVPVGVSHGQGSFDSTPIFINRSMRLTTAISVDAVTFIELYYPGDANLGYRAGPAIGFDQGIVCSQFGDPSDNRVIPINDDALFQSHQAGELDGIFVDFSGNLDNDGRAFFPVSLPDEPSLVGLSFNMTAISIDVAFPSDIKNIANAEIATIQ